MGLITNERIAVVATRPNGLEVETHATKLDLVLEMMQRGDLGGGNAFGCEEHLAALEKVEQMIPQIRKRIEEWNKPMPPDDDVETY